MAHIDNLIERISDERLRAQITAEVAKLVERKDFGLVFQDHLPEDLEVNTVRPRRGDVVRLRGAVVRQNFVVISTKKNSASIVAVDAAKQVIDENEVMTKELSELVVVKDFNSPIYPGMRVLSTIEAGGDKPAHLVIQGENYYALETLLYTHKKSVDVIYIDPPYNTGSDDWQYNDKYVDRTDGYRHSKWLAFMDRRLRHAQALLKDSGVIFISIDDNEQAHLRLLMDQIFGPQNFLDTIAVEMSTTSGPKVVNAQQGTIVKNIEYVHVYKKSEAFDSIRHTPLFDGVPMWDGDYALWLNDDGTVTSFVDELAADARVFEDMKRYGFVSPAGKFLGMKYVNQLLAVSVAADQFVLANLERIARRDIPPVSVQGMDAPVRGWIKVKADHRDYLLTRLRSGTLNQLYTLSRNYRDSDDYRPRYGRTVIRGDLWKGFFQDMGNVAKEGGVAFNNGKKPIRLIKQLIRWANNSPDAVILDFFGGSGSTTHAVMAMNAEDNGRRQSILITNNEIPKSIAARLRREHVLPGEPRWEAEGVFERVTRPRIETVVTGVRPDKSVYSSGVKENVAFLQLTYEDENLVALGRKFDAISPLLWMKAGSRGPILRRDGNQPWTTPEGATYGVLFDPSKAQEFAHELKGRPSPICFIYVVTDSDSQFRAAASYLPSGPEFATTRLYADFLHSFEISGKG
jgi:adenine-specific DNA-methyltransferase